MASGSDTILSFDEVIDAFFADDRLRSLLFHETYHFWQALRLPFLYFYGLKCFYNVIKALPQLLPLVAIPEARKGFAIGAVPEFAQISQKQRVSMWPERATIDSEDVPSASDSPVPTENPIQPSDACTYKNYPLILPIGIRNSVFLVLLPLYGSLPFSSSPFTLLFCASIGTDGGNPRPSPATGNPQPHS